MKILVADDSQTNLILITDALNDMEHEVIATKNGTQAIQAFLEQKPDLIILDVLMDDMDGFECARKLRKIEQNDWIPIIFLSASVDDESIAKGIDAGGDDYLTKPFSQITLAAKIKAMQRISDMRKKLYDATCQLSLLSATDSLTGLYNRLQFNRSIAEKIEYAKRHAVLLVLLFIDLDNFKFINDHYGHHMGDSLLKEVAERLKSCVRKYDFIARLGGDEFAIIIQEVKTQEEASVIAQKVLSSLSAEYTFLEKKFKIEASIGIACFPFAGTEPDSLIRHADMAMYHAKELGRNNCQYFTEELFEQESQQNCLRHALKYALERNEFFILYDPIFDLQSQKPIGIEALLHWNHPQYGSILPKRFQPLADEIGVSALLNKWFLESICEQANQWTTNQSISELKISFAVSNSHLLDKNFPQQIKKIVNKTGFQIENLALILEFKNVLVAKYNQILEENIRQLSKMGFRIVMDDFGFGFSPLLNIKNLPINCLKINKSFTKDIVEQPHVKTIIHSISQLAKDMNLEVIAKGIETNEQRQELLKNGCQYGQGDYLSQPLEAEKMMQFFQKIKG